MVDFDLKRVLFEELGYDRNPEIKDVNREQPGRAVPYVEQVYKVQDVQVAYFCRFEAVDANKLWELHRAVWNESKTPLLFVVLPQEIRVYNGYAFPSESPHDLDNKYRLLRHLRNIVDIEVARREIRSQLYQNNYDRVHLETGAFWDTEDGRRIDKSTRADNRLLRAMDALRRKLSDAGLAPYMNYAYALIGRSIFIRYLEDRGILSSLVFDNDNSPNPAGDYLHILRDKILTYQFFTSLSQKFGGDLFPVLDSEDKIIEQTHLDFVANFLSGTDLETGQLSFWPFDFEYIPIELISGIYDTFLNTSTKRGAGTYYTPHTLADFVLEETMPLELVQSSMKILDPACGSGVFLVRAYQRLVDAWIRENDGILPSISILKQLMSDNIFGVDIDENAVRIASFSLYLTILDNLDKASLAPGDLVFPLLKDENLLVGDFFHPSVQKQLKKHRFARIIGNPPWVSDLTDAASEWINQHGYIIGDNQIAQAFLLATPSLCKEDGEVALLAPAKGTISVTSATHTSFRKTFLENHSIRALFNLSALCYELFEDAIHPTVVIFYSAGKPNLDRKFVYLTPKPTSLFQQIGSIVIETMDVKYLTQRRVLEFPSVWKIALWGTPRDEVLVEKLTKRFHSLSEEIERYGISMYEGLSEGGRKSIKEDANWLLGMTLASTNEFRPYVLDAKTHTIIKNTRFTRPRSQEIFRAPLALIRQSPSRNGFLSAFTNVNLVYKNNISGVVGQPGQEWILKWLVIYINSPLAQYYHFMTASRWAIERSHVLHEEFKRMPFLIPQKSDQRLKASLELFDQLSHFISNDNGLNKQEIDPILESLQGQMAELVFDIFDIYPHERQLIRDTVDYVIDFFYWGKRKNRKPKGSLAVESPTMDLLSDYADQFIQVANTLLQYQHSSLRSVIYQNGSPLAIVGFRKTSLTTNYSDVDIEIVESSQEIRQVLKRLDTALLEQKAPSLYMRRQVRIYDGDWMYLIRPSERRFWTKSQALVDADETIAEWLMQPTAPAIPEGAVSD